MQLNTRVLFRASAAFAALAFLSLSTVSSAQVTGSGTANQVSKWTSSNALGNSAITETSGKVGVGVTSPQQALHIGNGLIRVDRSTDGAGLQLYRPSLKAFTLGVNASGTNNGEFFISDLGNSITGSPSRRFTISTSGNVGIATSTPAHKLTVAGGIQSTSGGFYFPDGSLQTTAATPFDLHHTSTLFGSGTLASPLGVSAPLVLSSSTSGVVQGLNTGSGNGVYGKSVSGDGVNGSSDNIGVYGSGVNAGVSSYGGTYGLVSIAYGAGTADGVHTTGANGVYALSNRAGGNGVFAQASNNNTSDYAIWGLSSSGFAGVFSGNVNIYGTLTKSAGTFKIDHPLDPENKYLSHSFVESPDMMNIYNGIAELDGGGQAIVSLPGYFSALNRDFRYQLTAVGAPGPGLYIADEIAGNQFRIAGGKPGAKVSWQVTGIRQDAYANAHRTPIEEDKPEKERGTYIHPDLFGKSEEKGREWAIHPETMKRARESAFTTARR